MFLTTMSLDAKALRLAKAKAERTHSWCQTVILFSKLNKTLSWDGKGTRGGSGAGGDVGGRKMCTVKILYFKYTTEGVTKSVYPAKAKSLVSKSRNIVFHPGTAENEILGCHLCGIQSVMLH